MAAYYNEIDPKAAAWLRQLIKNGLIMDGEVDERSIIDVQPSDLKGFNRWHFFAGVAGWDLALQLAGWPIDRPIVTASLPCQPFSVAGQQKGKEDDRDLLPHFIELVKQCNFGTIIGEQVPGAIRHGWIDYLQAAMETENYAVGFAVLGAHSAGAPHIRQRLYWIANSHGVRRISRREGSKQETRECAGVDSRSAHNDWMADSISEGRKEQPGERGISLGEVGNDAGENLGQSSGVCGLSDLSSQRHERRQDSAGEKRRIGFESACGEWDNPEWLYCRDNKYRPTKPGIKPLVDGLSHGVVRSGDTSEPINTDNTQEARAMRLKGYGNAIVPAVAASFIRAFMGAA